MSRRSSGRQFDCRGSDVLFEAMQLRGARDRNDPRLLREQPGERDLSGSRFLALRDAAEQIDHAPDSPSGPPA